MTQEALKLALEALELCNGAETVEGVVIYTNKEITAIKEALRENAMREVQRLGQEIEQEPVAWINEHGHIDCGLDAILDPTGWTPLYTHPPQRTWVGLTDEQVEKIIKSNMSFQMNLAGIRQDFEAAHGIKENT